MGRTCIFEAIVNLNRPLLLNSLLEESLMVCVIALRLMLTEHNSIEIVFGDS